MAEREKFTDIVKAAKEVERIKKMKGKKSRDRFKHFKTYYSLYNIIHQKSKYPRQLRRMIVKFMEKKHLRGLNEAVEAALDATVDLHPDDFKTLKRLRGRLREFKSLKHKPKLQKHHLIHKEQKGGFLSILIPSIASIASGLVGEGIHAAVRAGHHHKKKRRR